MRVGFVACRAVQAGAFHLTALPVLLQRPSPAAELRCAAPNSQTSGAQRFASDLGGEGRKEG